MSRKLAFEKLESLYESVDAKTILEYLIGNYLSGATALQALESAEEEFCGGCDCECNEDCELE